MRVSRSVVLVGIVGVLAGSIGGADFAIGADLCYDMRGMKLSVTANGYDGEMGPIEGNPFKTTTVFKDKSGKPEQPDPVSGSCSNGKINFTRTRQGSFVQTYEGVLAQEGHSTVPGLGILIRGSFHDDSGSKWWPWIGWTVQARKVIEK